MSQDNTITNINDNTDTINNTNKANSNKIGVNYARIIQSIINFERKVEDARIRIIDYDFIDPYTCFKLIDENNNGYLIADDIFRFMKKCIKFISIEDVQLILKSVSNTMTYNDFLTIILPQTNLILRDILLENCGGKYIDREFVDIEKQKMMQIISNIIQKEIEYYQEINRVIMPFKNYDNQQLNELFYMIDKDRKGYFNYENLQQFMNNQNIPFTKKEYSILLRRIDKANNNIIYMSDFRTNIFGLLNSDNSIENSNNILSMSPSTDNTNQNEKSSSPAKKVIAYQVIPTETSKAAIQRRTQNYKYNGNILVNETFNEIEYPDNDEESSIIGGNNVVGDVELYKVHNKTENIKEKKSSSLIPFRYITHNEKRSSGTNKHGNTTETISRFQNDMPKATFFNKTLQRDSQNKNAPLKKSYQQLKDRQRDVLNDSNNQVYYKCSNTSTPLKPRTTIKIEQLNQENSETVTRIRPKSSQGKSSTYKASDYSTNEGNGSTHAFNPYNNIHGNKLCIKNEKVLKERHQDPLYNKYWSPNIPHDTTVANSLYYWKKFPNYNYMIAEADGLKNTYSTILKSHDKKNFMDSSYDFYRYKANPFKNVNDHEYYFKDYYSNLKNQYYREYINQNITPSKTILNGTLKIYNSMNDKNNSHQNENYNNEIINIDEVIKNIDDIKPMKKQENVSNDELQYLKKSKQKITK